MKRITFFSFILGALLILDEWITTNKNRRKPTKTPREPASYNGVSIPVGKRNRRARPCI